MEEVERTRSTMKQQKNITKSKIVVYAMIENVFINE